MEPCQEKVLHIGTWFYKHLVFTRSWNDINPTQMNVIYELLTEQKLSWKYRSSRPMIQWFLKPSFAGGHFLKDVLSLSHCWRTFGQLFFYSFAFVCWTLQVFRYSVTALSRYHHISSVKLRFGLWLCLSINLYFFFLLNERKLFPGCTSPHVPHPPPGGPCCWRPWCWHL